MNNPFFIIGCGRSGTTLLRAMLNSHPRLAIPLESLFIADYLHSDTEQIRQVIGDEYEIKEWGLQPGRVDLSECDTPASIIRRLHQVFAAKHGKERWGQKTPRLVRHVPLLADALPDAQFIHLVRDPRGVVNSLIHSPVHRSNALYGSQRWVNDVTAGLAAEHDQGALHVYYEDLVCEPEETMRDILDFLGESYDERVLSYQHSSDEYGEYYDTIHSKLDEEPDPSRVTAWKDELSETDKEVIAQMTSATASKAGFSVPNGVSHPCYRAWLRAQRGIGLAQQLTQYLLHRREYLWSFIRRKACLRTTRRFDELNY